MLILYCKWQGHNKLIGFLLGQVNIKSALSITNKSFQSVLPDYVCLLFINFKVLIFQNLDRLFRGSGWIESYLVVNNENKFSLGGSLFRSSKHYK